MTDANAAPADRENWIVYVLECLGNRLYCGIAKDVDARYAEHAAGKGAKFTRAFPPERIVIVRTFETKSAALKAESAFKALSRASKNRQIATWTAEAASIR